jgi:hypothetical protein
MTLTGRLQVEHSGRPVQIEAVGSEVVFRVANLRSAWKLRGSTTQVTPSTLAAFRRLGLRVRLKIGSWLDLGVLPKPHLLIRFLLPALRAA